MSSRIALLALPLLVLAACSGGPDCPEGSSPGPRGNCVPTGRDAGTTDTGVAPQDGAANPDATELPDGAQPDATTPDTGDDAGSNPDATEPDAQDTDGGGNPDAMSPDAGFPGATVTPQMLDLGRVVVGTRVRRLLRVENLGSMPATVSALMLSGANASELTMSITATLAAGQVILGPGEGFDVQIDFAPSSVGSKSASLDLSLCDAGCAATVPLTGEGLLTSINCTPMMIDFGSVNPSTCQSVDLVCTNVSSEDAAVIGVAFTAGASREYSLALSPSLPATLTGSSTLTATVRYCPTNLGQDVTQVAVTLVHPVPAQSTQLYTVSGVGGGPNIQCTPSTVDFGLVGVGQSTTRRVTCRNTGNVPLLVQSAAYSAGTTPQLSLSTSVGGANITLPNTIAPASAIDLDLGFAPLMPASHLTTLTIVSNDNDSPSTAIPVNADAIDTTGCTIQVAPASLDFGGVAPGNSVSGRVRVSNVGAGGCAVNVVGFAPGSSASFSLVTGPANYALSAGDSIFVEVAFGPLGPGPFTGTLSLQASDSANPNPTVALSGSGAPELADIAVLPAHLEFGTVPSGCSAGNRKQLTIYNRQLTAVRLTQVTMAAGSGAGFAASGGVLPVTIPPAGSATVTVTFTPTMVGGVVGRVQIGLSGIPPIYVPVSADGGPAGAAVVTDNYPAGPAPLVDVLLIVDDSGSMGPYQALLAGATDEFIARGDAAGADYHVAVVTTDGSPGIVGTMRGTPAVVASTDADRSAHLAANTNVGVNGAGVEEAFRCSATAVTDPALLSAGNSGFLRPGANLVVVILSDEDDQSAGATLQYVDTLRNRVGGAPSVTVYALDGGLLGCTGPNGQVPPAPRYDEAVQATGGFHESICATSYTAAMTRIADATFNRGRLRYPLSVAPAPGSLSVTVDGVARPAVTGTIAQWFVDYRAPALSFAPTRAPGGNHSVAIRYNAFCVPSTCGNAAPNPGEQCDDGNPNNTDACPNTCYSPVCGDGFVRAGTEQCDDGNTIPGDGCNSLCTVEGCGNGVLEPGEQCDNGPANSDTTPNACRTSCETASCGDAVRDMGEACDDGNAVQTDNCLVGCVAARCGDGFVRSAVEQCDDGNTIDTDECHNNCTFNGAGYTVTRVNNVVLTPTPGAPLTFMPSNDDGTASVAIGFPFAFLGTPVTTAIVSTNGLVAFAPTNAQAYQNTTIPNTATPNAFIALWWDDLNISSMATPVPTVTSTMTGTAPNRIRRIAYNNVPHFSFVTGDARLNMELRIHETTGVIDVVYGTLLNGASTATPFDATTGWESPSGTRGADALGCGDVCDLANWPTNTRVTYTP